MEAYTFTEPTKALRDWLRTISALDTVLDAPAPHHGIWAGGFPTSATEGIAITRIGGGIDVVDEGLYQFDCLAATAPRAAQIGSALASALVSAAPTVIDVTSGLAFAGVGQIEALALTDSQRPDDHRLVVTASISTKTLTP